MLEFDNRIPSLLDWARNNKVILGPCVVSGGFGSIPLASLAPNGTGKTTLSI